MLHLLHLPTGHIVRFPIKASKTTDIEAYTKYKLRGKGVKYTVTQEDINKTVASVIQFFCRENPGWSTFKNNKELANVFPLAEEFEVIEVA